MCEDGREYSTDAETLIIMASYNGADFIAEQLKSIIKQDYTNWSLLLRDDGSSDNTVDIFNQAAGLDPRLSRLDDGGLRLGAAESFHCLMQAAAKTSVQYIVFSDQDDVWFPNKLSKQITLIKELGRTYQELPLLVHSDMEVVDAKLNKLAPSFMHYQGINDEKENPLEVLLVQNYVTGCTVVVNRELLKAALPMPGRVLMHDWWLALIAGASGRIQFVDEPLIQYRQHGLNAVGAKPLGGMLNPACWVGQWLSGRTNLAKSLLQAKELAARVESLGGAGAPLLLIKSYSGLRDKGILARLRQVKRLGVHAQSRIRNILLMTRLMALK